jgi:hypothetical protein
MIVKNSNINEPAPEFLIFMEGAKTHVKETYWHVLNSEV